MEFRILGPLEAVEDGRLLELGGPKQRALLAVLLLEANRVVSSGRLVDALWEEDPPETAQKVLQVYVSQLRKLLGKQRLETKAPGYLLHVEADELDLARFQRLQGEGSLQEALSLWRGQPLAEFADQRFAQAEIARLEELRLACLEEQVERNLDLGLAAELVGELEGLVREHPLRERLRCQFMLALYRSGRQAEALEVYQATRRALVEELGVEPGRALRELHQAILNQDPALDLAHGTPSELIADARRGVLVGRESELGELVAGLDEAFAGRGRLFLVVGEPGIGKSRVAEELVSRARARGARVLVGRCWEAGGAPAYWPWVQALRAYVRETDPEALGVQLGAGAVDLAQLLPELRQLFPNLAEPPALEPERARFRLFEAASSFMRNVAQVRPVVIVLDDLHAADEPSLLLLQFLARELGESRLLVVGAYRDIDPSPSESLTRVLTELAREPVTKRLTLTGLSEPDVARYIEFVSGEVPGAGLVVAIHEETEGNPLFVGEIVRLLAVEGGLDDAAAPVLAIPQGVRDVIARRLRHLSSECNRVLVLASVLGREFALDALASVSGLAEADLLEALDEAMQARVASDVPGSPGRLRFAHVLIRDTLYDGLTTVGRVRLHRLAADALEQLYNPDLGPHLAELAHHAIAGSDFTRGSDYARRAGDRALVLLAYEEAARLYEIALEAIDLASPLDERTRCHLLLSLGETRARAGDMAAAKRVFLEAAELSGRLDLPRELAQSAAGYGGRIVFERAGGDERLVPLLEAGLAGLGPNDIELQVRLLARLGGALRDEHSRQRRDRLSAEAVDLARGAGDPAALAYALDGRCAAILAPDTITEYLELATELLELSNRLDDREHLVHAHNHRVIAQILIGDVHLAEAELEASSRVAEELGQPAQLWLQYAARAMLALAAGKQTEAQDLVPKAFAFGGRAQVMALSVYWLQGYALCDFHGGIEQIEPEISELAAHNPARPVLRCALTHLYARLGRTAQAAAELADLSTNDFAVLPFDMEWLYAVSLAEICAALGDQDSAAVLYRQLAPWAMLNTVDLFEGARGSASRYLGLLASAMSRWDDAAQHFEQALVMNQRMGARPWLAHTQHDYARTLIARNDRGDRERANELLDHALATYHELGMHNYATNTAELIKRELTTTPNSTAQPS